MINRWKAGVGRVLFALLFALAATMTALADDATFVQGTSVNGLGIGGLTVEEAAGRIESFYSSQYQLTIREKGGKQETISGAAIGFSIGLPDGFLEEILDAQNAAGRLSGPDVDNAHRTEMANTFDEAALREKIQNLACVSGNDIVVTADASISAYQEGEPFTIIPEVVGNNVDEERLTAQIEAAVAAGDAELDLEESGCYVLPSVTQEDASLIALCDTLNLCREMTITYVVDVVPTATKADAQAADEDIVLSGGTICSWITGVEDGMIQVDPEQTAAFVANLAAVYNTSGTVRTFHTVNGQDVSVSGPYGWVLDQAAEIDALVGMIRTGQTQSREPVFSSSAVSHGAQEWGSTYAEVDLAGQHAYLIQDGALVWDAPCVTGNLAKGYDTPAGIYSLTYKTRDRVLRGALQADGTYEYESPVSYWMPFNGGIGFHDASWRVSFGGEIYKTNGSHGCVNLPPAKAKLLYDLVYTGMPVICY